MLMEIPRVLGTWYQKGGERSNMYFLVIIHNITLPKLGLIPGHDRKTAWKLAVCPRLPAGYLHVEKRENSKLQETLHKPIFVI